MAEVIDRLIAAGYEPFGRSYDNPTWHEMFLHPKAAHGVLLQVVRHPPHTEPPRETLAEYLARIE